jgi:hypothetical protein
VQIRPVRNNTSIESNGAHKKRTNKHMIRKYIIIVTLGVVAFAATSFAYENPKVGAAAMSQDKNIVQNATNPSLRPTHFLPPSGPAGLLFQDPPAKANTCSQFLVATGHS